MSAFDIDWRNPDYTPVFEFRAEALERIRQNPKALGRLQAYYKDNWVDFINDWGMTYDPRKQGQKYSPFILFPKQEAYINWLYDLYTTSRRGLAEKSREVGFTWLSAAAGVCIWLFHPHAVVGFGSRKKELVDNGDADPDSIFWKVRMFIDMLPTDFLPANHTQGRKAMVVPNPANKAVIKGEIGDEIGRGGRAGIYFVDEFAHLEHPDMAESALSANTDCRIYVSTVNGPGNLFYRLRHFLPTEQIFIFDWKDDPRKRLNPDLPPEEEPWYQKQKKELLPTTLASQVDRNYHAASATGLLGEDGTAALKAAMSRKRSTIVEPKAVWAIGVDAAGMGNDEIIIWRRLGRINLDPIPLPNMDGVQLAACITQEAKLCLQTAPLGSIVIERDGPGGSAADQLRYGPFASVLLAIHTGAKLKDGRHYNLRAFLHTQALEYLTDQDPVLPQDNIFEAQATAIQKAVPKGGLILIESKEEYRSRFALGKSKQEKSASKSPDRWDAFVLSFMPTRSKPIRQLDAEDPLFFPKRTSGWQPRDRQMNY